MDPQKRAEAFRDADRPDVALLTNHGYAGSQLPVGGAPDTGGQNLYVNTLALRLAELGYRVTIFTRGGFAYFESDQIRSAPEYLSEHVRYVFIPGGGDSFIRKEDIATALDEEIEWLDAFLRREGAERSREPWECYEFISSHYWDAALMAVRLIERWRDDLVERSIRMLLEGIVDDSVLEQARRERHWRAMGQAPSFHLGYVLLQQEGRHELPLEQRVRAAASQWSAARGLDARAENAIVDRVVQSVTRNHEDFDPLLERLQAAASLGSAILAQNPEVDERLKRDLDRVDRHAWTPHSIGELKDYNYRGRPIELRRTLKLCERRSHERMVCDRTRAFAATSAKIALRLWSHFRVPIEDTFYFPPCVNGDVFRPYGNDEKEMTYRYLSELSGIPEETLKSARIILETSRMDQTKRKDLVLAAFARIAPRYDDVFLFVGGGPRNDLYQGLQHQVDFTETLEGRAFLTGPIPDVHIGPIFSVADIYATASEMEGFGMSVSQAAAAGTAIVSTDTIPFSIHHASDDAELFSPGDIQGFTEGLSRLLEDDAEREARAARLQETARALDWSYKTAEFLRYLRRRGFEIADGNPDG